MHEKTPTYYELNNNQNFMASILQRLPQESAVTKIEYEGPYIALYSKNPSYLIRNVHLISQMVNAIKKRIVVRSDESIRSEEQECEKILYRSLPDKTGLIEALFDPSFGEVTALVKNPMPLSSSEQSIEININLLEKTGWKITIRKAPSSLVAIRQLHKILRDSSNVRLKFYRDVGEKIFRNKLNDVTEAGLITLGGFAEIGRSAVLLSTNESKILLDCGIGLTSNADPLNNYPRFDMEGPKLDEIDAVVVSHAHLDHTGFIPALFKYGFLGPVYCSEPTLPLMYILQKKLLSIESAELPFSLKDVEEEVIHTIPLSYGNVTDISPDIRLALSNSGHIIGSSLVHLHLGNGNHNLVYTGDFKFGKVAVVETASWNFPRVETLIMEGLYGSRDDLFPSAEEAYSKLVDSLNKTIAENGRILIPISSVGLSQELILSLDKFIKSGQLTKTKIYLEKIIAETNSIHELYAEYLARDLRESMQDGRDNLFSSEQFEEIDLGEFGEDSPAIILAPSSMLTGGPAVHYLKMISGEPKSKLILLSYQAPSTPGSSIKGGQREITICNQRINTTCQVEVIEGLRTHCDYNQLLAYANKLRPKLKRILVNHGERSKVQNLATSINRMFKIQTQFPLVGEGIKLL
jgi:uncharacterized protein